METSTTAERTEQMAIFIAARNLLNTMPPGPDSHLATIAASDVALMDYLIDWKDERICEFCGADSTVIGHYKTLPLPTPSTRYACDDCRDRITDCDSLTILGAGYWEKVGRSRQRGV